MENEFNLTEKERLSYILQLLILEKLSPKDETYKNIREALENGFIHHYKDLKEIFLYRELSIEDSKFVLDVLEMYRGLTYSAKDLSIENMNDVRFQGFDGNDDLEVKMMSYTKYFMEDLDRYPEIRDQCKNYYNSHMQMKPKYERMLSIWKKLSNDERYRMPPEVIESVLNA